MVCDKLYLICGNCGQDLTEKGMASLEIEDEDEDVYITCENCGTIHTLCKYMEQVNE